MPCSNDYKSPCMDCESYNPLTCEKCKEYVRHIFQVSSAGAAAAIKILNTVEKYWEDKKKELEDNKDLYTWEDYENI